MATTVSRYALAYLLWVISVAVAFVALLVSRSSMMMTLGATGWDRYFVHALNQFGFLFLAIFGLAVIIFTEHFYRTGVEKHRLFARFFLITLLELLFLTFMHLAGLISQVILGIFIPTALLIVVGEVILAFVLFWLYRQASRQAVTPVG
jgi:hypothetical protein